MKRLIILVSLMLLIGCGTAKQDEPMVLKATSVDIENDNETANEDEVVVPTERTVETNGNYPWQYFAKSRILELQSEGETVFLWSDVETLEEHIIQTATRDTEDNEQLIEHKKESAESMAGYVELFVVEVKNYIDNEPYFDKLNEVQQKLMAHDYESVVTLIEEAKQIRESE